MAKVGNRQYKTLVCGVCGEENYRVQKNVKKTTERLELNRYCIGKIVAVGEYD